MGIFKRKKVEAPHRRNGNRSDSVTDHISDPRNSFQRNRTIVASSQESKESSRSKTHHLTMKRRKVGYILLIVMLVSAILYLLLSQFSAKVVVYVKDNSDMSTIVDTNVYQEAINNYMGANPLERFKFVLNKDRLLESIQRDHLEVKAINDISMGKMGEIHVGLTMRSPVASWNINNKKYYVDSDGIAFETNYFKSPGVSIVDQSGISIDGNTPVASSRLLSFVGRVVSISANLKYTVTEAILPTDTTRQLEIRLKDHQPLIKLSIDRPAGEQVEDMLRSLKYLESKSTGAEYIDVRVAGKAVYK